MADQQSQSSKKRNEALFPPGYEFPEVTISIGIRQNDSPNTRAPVFKGWLALSPHQVEALAEHCQACLTESPVVFLDVALWTAPTGGNDDYKGTVSLRAPKIDSAPKRENPDASEGWY
jgi:hypothetical protein